MEKGWCFWSRVAFAKKFFSQKNPERRASRIRSGKTNQRKTAANVLQPRGKRSAANGEETGMEGKHHPLVGVKYLDVPLEVRIKGWQVGYNPNICTVYTPFISR